MYCNDGQHPAASADEQTDFSFAKIIMRARGIFYSTITESSPAISGETLGAKMIM
jgi:hypothetical protein